MTLFEKIEIVRDYMGDDTDTIVSIPFLYKRGDQFPFTGNEFITDDDADREVRTEINEIDSDDFHLKITSYHNNWEMLMPVIAKLINDFEELYNNENLKRFLFTNNITDSFNFVAAYIKSKKL